MQIRRKSEMDYSLSNQNKKYKYFKYKLLDLLLFLL